MNSYFVYAPIMGDTVRDALKAKAESSWEARKNYVASVNEAYGIEGLVTVADVVAIRCREETPHEWLVAGTPRNS